MRTAPGAGLAADWKTGVLPLCACALVAGEPKTQIEIGHPWTFASGDVRWQRQCPASSRARGATERNQTQCATAFQLLSATRASRAEPGCRSRDAQAGGRFVQGN